MKIVVPLVPPSVNSYVRHTRKGGHYVTKEARAFRNAICVLAAGRTVAAEQYEVRLSVYLGKGLHPDVDNLPKCCLDALEDAGVIHSDAAVQKLTVEKFRDWENPRTEIVVEEII